VIIILSLLSFKCQDKNYIFPTSPDTDKNFGGNNPGGGGSVFTQNKIEYRVTGNAVSARIRHSNSEDGLTQVVTTLPYVITITTNSDNLFLSLEATPSAYGFGILFPFMSVQIFTNGILFREATSSDFFLNTIAVSGTWRK
jgi:hypothetical protein